MPTPTIPPPPISVADGQAAARPHADAMSSDYTLARGKGETPEQVEARKRVAKLFCEIHLPGETSDQHQSHLAAIDYTCAVFSTNARGIDVSNPKSAGFLGMGRKKSYLVSQAYAPKSPEDPIYALEYFPVKR